MSDERSLEHVNDVDRRIDRMPASEEDERFVRQFVVHVAQTCPVEVLRQLARCVQDIRRRELEEEAEGN